MKNLVAELRASIAATLLLAVLCCGIYPAVVWAVGQGLFSDKANGSLVRVEREGRGFGAPGPRVRRSELFPPPAVGGGAGVRRGPFRGDEPRTDVEKTDRGREAAGCRLPGGKRPLLRMPWCRPTR